MTVAAAQVLGGGHGHLRIGCGLFRPRITTDHFDEVTTLETRQEVFQNICFHIAEGGLRAIFESIGECGKNAIFEIGPWMGGHDFLTLRIGDGVITNAEAREITITP